VAQISSGTFRPRSGCPCVSSKNVLVLPYSYEFMWTFDNRISSCFARIFTILAKILVSSVSANAIENADARENLYII
jgi:hypothetical protein